MWRPASISTRVVLSLVSCWASSTSRDGHPRHGDDLVLHWHGVTEAMNGDEEMFGEDVSRNSWSRTVHKSARDIEEHVYTEIRDFAA